jgi:hypothetical protein
MRPIVIILFGLSFKRYAGVRIECGEAENVVWGRNAEEEKPGEPRFLPLRMS